MEPFITKWFERRQPWSGLDEATLNSKELPQPLRWLYGFAGNSSDNQGTWKTIFRGQDFLIRFEELESYQGKIKFACEAQAVWIAGTEATGIDPPVWAMDDGHWHLVDDSLMNFLTTLILNDTVYSARHTVYEPNIGTSILAEMDCLGKHLEPIWIDHPYGWQHPRYEKEGSYSFYLVEDKYLIMKDCFGEYFCATNEEAPWECYPTLFDQY
ncbi:MAG: hypothetical protein R3C11_22015 [Planctomycetaceae bacterium]